MKKFSIIALALMSVVATNAYAVKAAGGSANRTAVKVTDPALGAYEPLTVTNAVPLPTSHQPSSSRP